MLNFFRKYQWYFFFVITIVVIISFSFFGTYSTLSSNSWGEKVAFKAVNGDDITRIEMEDMTNFLATDSLDKGLYGNAWGLNFLNDGVIRKDFLETGLAQELVQNYKADLQDDLEKRASKEKKFKLYSHPKASFVSVENAWNYFLPAMNEHYKTLKEAENPTDNLSFAARVNLYLGEKRFSPNLLRQVIRYQEQQHKGVAPDPSLDYTDLSLFGYHTLDDWFGPRFVRLVGQFIINTAILAEQKGYDVSRAEVLADLIRNTEISYRQTLNNPNIGVTSPQEYFNEQLRRLNMDQTRAIRVWRQVMLFRRYFHDVGNSVLVDTLVPQKFNAYTKQSAKVDLYRLPSDLHINDYATLQNFEVYLNAVTKKAKDKPLDVPKTFLTANEVVKSHPELVQKRYLLQIAEVNKKSLQNRVGVKETWNWEIDDKNWTALKKEFPELGIKNDASKEQRFAALEALGTTTRSKVDAFARAAIVDNHPEWIGQALEQAEPHIQVVGLRTQGEILHFEGLKSKAKKEELIKLLDEAPTGEKISDKLNPFTADNVTYYRIKVIEKDPEPSILTFAEANEDGTLDKIRDRLLEKHYATIREKNPSTYQNEDLTWKPYAKVSDKVADSYFDKVTKSLKTIAKKDSTKDQLAAYRFYTYLEEAKKSLEKDPASKLVRSSKDEPSEEKLVARAPLADQWLLDKSEHSLERGRSQPNVDINEALALKPEAWSSVKAAANGDIAFFQLKEQGPSASFNKTVASQTVGAYELLSAEAQQALMKQVLKQISDKGAISLNYLNNQEEDESQ